MNQTTVQHRKLHRDAFTQTKIIEAGGEQQQRQQNSNIEKADTTTGDEKRQQQTKHNSL